MTHVRALDGVRGIAVAMVVFYHSDLLDCGWAGVQLFFVLSGFLITSLLLGQKGQALKAYLARFYKRRALRILPVFLLYVGGVTLLHVVFGQPEVTGKQFLLLYTQAYNLVPVLSGGSDNRWLSHLWSLAVEEQFYFFWPLVVFFLSPAALKRLVLITLLSIPLARLLFAANAGALTGGLLISYVPTIVYRLTPFQFDAFAAGAAVALLPAPTGPGARRVFLVGLALALGLGAIHSYILSTHGPVALTSFGYPPDLPRALQYVWGYSVINVVSALFIRSCLDPVSRFTFLEHPALVSLGKISYGLYVFHLPVRELVLVTLGNTLTSFELLLIYAPPSYLLARLSYAWFERRFLALKDRPLRAWLQPA